MRFCASGEVPALSPSCNLTSACWTTVADCQRTINVVFGGPVWTGAGGGAPGGGALCPTPNPPLVSAMPGPGRLGAGPRMRFRRIVPSGITSRITETLLDQGESVMILRTSLSLQAVYGVETQTSAAHRVSADRNSAPGTSAAGDRRLSIETCPLSRKLFGVRKWNGERADFSGRQVADEKLQFDGPFGNGQFLAI